MGVAVYTLTGGPAASAASAANRFASDAGRDDVVFVAGAQPLGAGWLEALSAAAADSTVATASALGAARPEPPPAPATPLLPLPSAGCVLVRRAALDLAGPFDERAASWEEGLSRFAARCTARGMGHVLVSAVASPLASLTGGGEAQAEAALRSLDEHAAAPAARVLRAAARRDRRLRVAIDGRQLGGTHMAGTQVHALELVAALAATGAVELTVLTPPDLQPQAARTLGELDVAQVTYENVVRTRGARADLVHRPHQVNTVDDLRLLTFVGERLVITYQDSILYGNPDYFPNAEAWLAFRRVSHIALGGAARVIFFSEHARGLALREELVAPDRAAVVPIGVDHRTFAPGERAPEGIGPAEAEAAIVYLGTDLLHKNRPFALRLAAALRARHGWDGPLVLAGPHVERGSSRDEERTLSSEGVVELGAVTEEEKRWLLARARAVVYPSVIEGFGLVPFEAALAGTPCLFAPQAALAEELPGLATLVPWDAEQSAAAAAPLLAEGLVREAHVTRLRERAAAYTWDRAAAGLLHVYEDALTATSRADALLADDVAERERALREAQAAHQEAVEACGRYGAAYEALRDDIGEDGLHLVGAEHGLLPADVQRALLAVSGRPALRGPVFAALRALYRVGRAGKGGDG